MTLNTSEMRTLKQAFLRADHEFLKEFVYLTEEAICNRIEDVDPSWSFSVNRLDHVGDQVVCHATLIIKEVARDGVGMQKVNEKAGEAEKGAATDALKRCARLFGIGRYLLGAPDKSQFDGWLAGVQKAQGLKPAAPLATASPSPTEPTVARADFDDFPPMGNPPPEVLEHPSGTAPISTQSTNGASATQSGSQHPQIGKLNMPALWRKSSIDGRSHFDALIRKLLYELHTISDSSTEADVLDAIQEYYAAKALEEAK